MILLFVLSSCGGRKAQTAWSGCENVPGGQSQRFNKHKDGGSHSQCAWHCSPTNSK